MRNEYKIIMAILLSFGVETAQAYGSGASSHSCEKPSYSKFQPAVSKYLQSFSEFSFEASANTSPTSIVVTIGSGENQLHFDHKELEITQLSTGHYAVKGKLDKPLEGGFARLNVTAHSKPGCEKTDGILIRIH